VQSQTRESPPVCSKTPSAIFPCSPAARREKCTNFASPCARAPRSDCLKPAQTVSQPRAERGIVAGWAPKPKLNPYCGLRFQRTGSGPEALPRRGPGRRPLVSAATGANAAVASLRLMTSPTAGRRGRRRLKRISIRVRGCRAPYQPHTRKVSGRSTDGPVTKPERRPPVRPFALRPPSLSSQLGQRNAGSAPLSAGRH
jgi:hypothetical protein